MYEALEHWKQYKQEKELQNKIVQEFELFNECGFQYKAKAKQDVRLARRGATFKIASAGGEKMLSNLGETGNPFRSKIGEYYDPDQKKYVIGTTGPFGRNQTWKPVT